MSKKDSVCDKNARGMSSGGQCPSAGSGHITIAMFTHYTHTHKIQVLRKLPTYASDEQYFKEKHAKISCRSRNNISLPFSVHFLMLCI